MSLYSEDRAIIDKVDGERSDPEQDKIETALKTIVDSYDREEDEERTNRLAEVGKHLLFWHGEHNVTWNEADRSWLTVWDAFEEGLLDEEDVEEYEKSFNIFRAYGEIIIAASSIDIPRLRFHPKKATNPMDVITAREYTKISEMLDIENNSEFLIQQAHFILYNQHFLAGYTYIDESPEHGVINQNVMGMRETMRQTEVCPNCLADIAQSPEQITDDFQSLKECPNCEQYVDPQPFEEPSQEYGVVGQQEYNRGKVCIDLYGPRNVKIPAYAKSMKACPYLIFDDEVSLDFLADLYSEKAKDILGSEQTDSSKYDRWVRETTRSRIAGERNGTGTHRLIWLRPWAYHRCGDEEMVAQLKQKYPEGALVVFVNDLFIKCLPSNMDEHWQITTPAMSESMHDDPFGKLIMAANEIEDDLLTLDLESVKHNIPEVYYDPAGMDTKAYNQLEARPGMRIPMKPRDGQSLSANFFETRGVTLTRDNAEIKKYVNERAQFLVSAVPSIWGGYIQGGSKTAEEYESSRQGALQRLGLRLRMVNWFWAGLKKKSVDLYKENMEYDEDSYSVDMGGGNYKDVNLRRENLGGEVGRVVPEASAAYPMTWHQKRGVFMQSLESGSPQLLAYWFHPENTTLLKNLIGVPELYIPGENDRIRQLEEIEQNLQGIPVQVLLTDNATAHAAIIQTWASSDEGRKAMEQNPQGFALVMQHLQQHMIQLKPPMPPPGPPNGGEEPSGPGPVGPVEGPPGPPQGGM